MQRPFSRKIKAAIYSWRWRRKYKHAEDKVGKLEMVAFPAECSKCNREANAPRFGCGWDDQYKGKGRVSHTWDPDLKTCPRYYLEHDGDVSRLLYELEDYRRGALGPVGQLPAPNVDYLRIADVTQRQWAEEGEQ